MGDKILEFLRVQLNVLVLTGLFIFLFKMHAPDVYLGGVIGALLQAMQTQRTAWKPAVPAVMDPKS